MVGKIFASSKDEPGTARPVGQPLTHWAAGAPEFNLTNMVVEFACR